ncbi:Inositol-pentakisphosphate 2-kinase [Xylographa soralifera]|nr:Inositol-pentakisphosphate 2-kinase [Xylographa soralifera]
MPLPSLPPSTHLIFLAEGAANIVYRISLPPTTPPLSASPSWGNSTPPPSEIEFPTLSPPSPPHLHQQLLRLRKALPTTTPILSAQAHHDTLLKPHFAASDLVAQTPVALPPGLVRSCNGALRAMEAAGRRDVRRTGVWLDEGAEVGLLVEDMTAEGWAGEGAVLCLEFKPKWLAQSLGAPRGARRCRSCALGAMRSGEEGGEGRAWCPLGLVARERGVVERAVAGVVAGCGEGGQSVGEGVRGRVVDFLMGGGLLGRLRDLQVRFDARGSGEGDGEGDGEGEEFRLAMTLRDCTLYLRIPSSEGGVVEAKLGDMDLKSAAKARYWRELEERLVREDWYAVRGPGGNAVETVCLLSVKA